MDIVLQKPAFQGGEDRFECSFDKVSNRSLYPVTYLLPLKERPDWEKKTGRRKEGFSYCIGKL